MKPEKMLVWLLSLLNAVAISVVCFVKLNDNCYHKRRLNVT
jgi:hypothetical protein